MLRKTHFTVIFVYLILAALICAACVSDSGTKGEKAANTSVPTEAPTPTIEPTPSPSPVPEIGFRYDVSGGYLNINNVYSGYSRVTLLLETAEELTVTDIPESYDTYQVLLPENSYSYSFIIKESEESETVYTVSGPKALSYAISETPGKLIISAGFVPEIDGNHFLNASGFDIIWEENAPDFETMEQYACFKTYNGQEMDSHLGGNIEILPETVTISGVQGTINGNYISFSYGYSTKFNINSGASCTGIEGAECKISFYDDVPYLSVTDSAGSTRSYLVSYAMETLNLPIIYIDTNGAGIYTTDTFVAGSVTIDYNGLAGSEAWDAVTDATMQIRGRGHSSWKLAKKPYKIKFDEKTSVFGLHKAKDWVLLANHVDKSLIRNTLAMEMSSLLDKMCFIPTSYMVDVFLNGEYIGVYSISEQIEVKKGRIEAEKNGTEVDTDYLIEFGGESLDTSFGTNIFSTSLCKWLQIKSPDNENITKEQYNFIKDYFTQVDNAVKSGQGYEELLDVDSLIDWFIMDEISYNLDCSFRRSVFLLKKAGGKLYMACPWDFDYAFGNFSLDDYSYKGWICLGNTKTDNYNEYIKTNWMDYLLNDENFKARLKQRWQEIGEALLKKGLETIDSLEVICTPSAVENFKVWTGVLGQKIQFESAGTRNLATYVEQVDYLRNFLKNRYAWMNETINNM